MEHKDAGSNLEFSMNFEIVPFLTMNLHSLYKFSPYIVRVRIHVIFHTLDVQFQIRFSFQLVLFAQE